MKANIYIDGFNSYFRLLRNTPYKWLDISKLFTYVAEDSPFSRLKIFMVAHVSARPDDLDQPEGSKPICAR